MGKSPGPSNSRHSSDSRSYHTRHRHPYNPSPTSSHQAGFRERNWGLNRFSSNSHENFRGNPRPRGGGSDNYRGRYFSDYTSDYGYNTFTDNSLSGRSKSAEGTPDRSAETQHQKNGARSSPSKNNPNSDYLHFPATPNSHSSIGTSKDKRFLLYDNARTPSKDRKFTQNSRHDPKRMPRTPRVLTNVHRRFGSPPGMADRQPRSPKPSTSRSSPSPALNPIELARQKTKIQLTEKLKARLEQMRSGHRDESHVSDDAEPPGAQSRGKEPSTQDNPRTTTVSRATPSSTATAEPETTQTTPSAATTTTESYVMPPLDDIGFVQCSGDEALEVLQGFAVVDSVGETETPPVLLEEPKPDSVLPSPPLATPALRPEFEKKKQQVLSNILKMDKTKLRKLMDEPHSNTSKFVLEHLVRENQAREEARKRSRVRLSSEGPPSDVCEVDISGFPQAIIEQVHQILLQTHSHSEDDDEIQVLEAPPKPAPPCICIDHEDSQDARQNLSAASSSEHLAADKFVLPPPVEAVVNDESLDEFGRLVASDQASEVAADARSVASGETRLSPPRSMTPASVAPSERCAAHSSLSPPAPIDEERAQSGSRAQIADANSSLEEKEDVEAASITQLPCDSQRKEPEPCVTQPDPAPVKVPATPIAVPSPRLVSNANVAEKDLVEALREPVVQTAPRCEPSTSAAETHSNTCTPPVSVPFPSEALPEPSTSKPSERMCFSPEGIPHSQSFPSLFQHQSSKETVLQQRLHQLSELLYEDKKTLEELTSVHNQIHALMGRKYNLIRKMDFLKKRQAEILNATPGMEFSRFQMLSSVPDMEEDMDFESGPHFNVPNVNVPAFAPPPVVVPPMRHRSSSSFSVAGSPFTALGQFERIPSISNKGGMGQIYPRSFATPPGQALNVESAPAAMTAAPPMTVSSNLPSTPPVVTEIPAPSSSAIVVQSEASQSGMVKQFVGSGSLLTNEAAPAGKAALSALLVRLDKELGVSVNPSMGTEGQEAGAMAENRAGPLKRKLSPTEQLTQKQQEKKIRINAIQATFSTSGTEPPVKVLSDSATNEVDGMKVKVSDKLITYMQPRHTGTVREVLVCDTVLLTASDDKSVNIYDMDSGQRKLRIGNHSGRITCLTVTPNVVDKHGGEETVSSRRLILLTGCSDGCIRSFDLDTGELLNVKGGNPAITCLTTKWGMGYFGTETGDILSYNLKRQTVKFNKCSAEQEILSLKAAKLFEERVLIIAARKNSVAIRELKTGFLVRTLEHTLGTIYSLALCSRYIYCSDADKTLSVYDRNSGDVSQVLKAPSIVTCLAVAHPFLYLGCKDGSVKVISAQGFAQFAEYTLAISAITDIAVHGNKVFVGNKAGDVGCFHAPRLIPPRSTSE